MKTIREWLETIPDEDVRAKAINNFENEDPTETKVPSLYRALYAAFTWSQSPEGHAYWSSVIYKLT